MQSSDLKLASPFRVFSSLIAHLSSDPVFDHTLGFFWFNFEYKMCSFTSGLDLVLSFDRVFDLKVNCFYNI